MIIVVISATFFLNFVGINNLQHIFAFILVMRYFKNHISRLVAFVIALQILNMSIDAPNAQMPVGKASSDNFNYIDTYVEYIAEVILKFDNAIPESKDRQQKELQQHKQFEVAFQKIVPITISFVEEKEQKHFSNLSNKYAYQFIKEINPPPPKA